MKYLLDASALMILIKSAETQKLVACLQDYAITDLTFYEIGNAIYKESILTGYLDKKDAEILAAKTQIIIIKINKITSKTEDFPKILTYAQKEKLTYYDSSYLHHAKQANLTLITEDKELQTKAQEHISVQTVKTLLS